MKPAGVRCELQSIRDFVTIQWILMSQASGKRRRALLRSNPLSNTRRARLHTAADRGGAKVPPPGTRLLLVSALWLKNLRMGDSKGGRRILPPLPGPRQRASKNDRKLQTWFSVCNFLQMIDPFNKDASDAIVGEVAA